jgi:hypothetical protein
MADDDDNETIIVPEEVSSLWKSLDPAVRAALIESESNVAAAIPSSSSSSSSGAGAGAGGGGTQGRRALASSGPRIESSSHIGGSSFVCRTASPSWIKVRSDVYDEVKARREEELSVKVPVDISVTLPDGKTMVEDKVRKNAASEGGSEREFYNAFSVLVCNLTDHCSSSTVSSFFIRPHKINTNTMTMHNKTGGRQVPGMAHDPLRRRRHDLAWPRRLRRCVEGHVHVLRIRLRRGDGRHGWDRP